MRVDPESENDEEGKEKSHCHRKDEPRGEFAHETGKSPGQKDRGGECTKELKIGDVGSAPSGIGDDEGIAHAAEDTEIDIDQADDEEHEPKDHPFFALHWKNQFLNHRWHWSIRC